jgi:hypothetical protein
MATMPTRVRRMPRAPGEPAAAMIERRATTARPKRMAKVRIA